MGMLLYMMEQQNKNKAEGATEKVAPKPIPEVKEEKPKKKATATRQEIMKMNVATVREYAKEQGIEDTDEKSGAELKRVLCDKLFEESE
jgi:hypothetical protein